MESQADSVAKLGDFELHPPTPAFKRQSKPTLRNPTIPLNQFLLDPEAPDSILTVHMKNNRLALFDGELTK